MYCLRRSVASLFSAEYENSYINLVCSYLPLLLLPLPLSLSPVHLILLIVLTYILNRPCIYCSFLLVILLASSCHWSNRCFIDFSQHGEETSSVAAWFIPRLYTSASNAQANSTSDMGGFLADVANSTVAGMSHVLRDSASSLLGGASPKVPSSTPSPVTDAGVGTHWLKYLIGRSEWTLPCVGVKVVL